MNRVVILGAGLSGLISNYRLMSSVNVDSVKMYEQNYGVSRVQSTAAFYCHQFLNNSVTPESHDVVWQIESNYAKLEDQQEAYRQKIYGNPTEKVSIKAGKEQGWSIRVHSLLDCACVEFGATCTGIDIGRKIVWFDSKKVQYDTLISTLPLFVFLRLAGIKSSIEFKSKPIYVSVEKQPTNKEQMILVYYPDQEVPHYRRTYWQNTVTTESLKPEQGQKTTLPGKIYANGDVKELTDELNKKSVYFQGRYARWEPKHLIHHTWNNITKEIFG